MASFSSTPVAVSYVFFVGIGGPCPADCHGRPDRAGRPAASGPSAGARPAGPRRLGVPAPAGV